MCVICDGTLSGATATPSDGLAFDCVKHGAYAIAKTALPRFMKLAPQAKANGLERAKLFAPQRNGEVIITSFEV